MQTSGMLSTKIIRRIDELGRIVLPKEMRRTMRLREGDEMEIFLDGDGGLNLRRYSEIDNMGKQASNAACIVQSFTGGDVLITDNSEVLYCEGKRKQNYLGKQLSDEVIEVMNGRAAKIMHPGSGVSIIENVKEEGAEHIVPLIVGGDMIGALIALTDTASETAANYLKLACGMLALSSTR